MKQSKDENQMYLANSSIKNICFSNIFIILFSTGLKVTNILGVKYNTK